jgi:acetolactate synthase-1/2/3 large subunit
VGSLTIADLILCRLRDAGVGFIFGMPGGGSNLDLVAAAGRAGVPFVLTATETAAALAAVAQAEVSGCPGVCLTTLGPGVASVVNGVACASLERAPVLVLTDSHPASAGNFTHQRLTHGALLAPVVKWSATIGAEDADAVVREAIARATTDPCGPVHLECPGDIAGLEWHGHGRAPSPDREPAADPDALPALLHPELLEPLLSKAQTPLLLIGLGARRSIDAEAIAALCASHGVPAMVTYKAKGVVPDTDLHFAGVFTNGAIEKEIVAAADLLIGVGLDPVELLPRPWAHPQPIVNITPWPVDNRHVPFAAQLVSDVPAGMRRIGELLPRARWDLEDVHRTVVAQRQRLCPASTRLSAHRVVQVAADAAATRARVTVDAGAHMFPATMLWPVSRPNGLLISNGLSTMGFALPAAIGAALTERQRPVIALTGDGGLLMCAGELLTAVREQLRVITIVFSDGSLSLIDIKQQQRKFASSGVALGTVHWCRLAEGLGASAHLARDEAELTLALARALDHPGPSVIEATIDPSTYPETLRAVRGQ